MSDVNPTHTLMGCITCTSGVTFHESGRCDVCRGGVKKKREQGETR